MHILDSDHLKFLFTEDLYIIPEDNKEKVQSPKNIVVETPLLPEKKVKEINSKIEPDSKKSIVATKPDIGFIGGNRKNILLITDKKTEGILAEKEKTFLLKILQAVQLSIEDVAIINFDKEYNYQDLEEKFKSKTIIFFGIDPQLINTEFKTTLYLSERKSGVEILYANKLTEIERDVEKKKLLWTSLQTLFLSK